MSEAHVSTNNVVARNVRKYRQERGYSLGELARRAGLSKQTLSKVELGQGNPTVETLELIGTALDVPARRLFTEWGSPVFVQRAAGAEWTESGGLRERELDQVYGSGYVRSCVVELPKGADLNMAPLSSGALHHLYVMTGRLETGPASEPITLGPGDFTRYPADVAHRFEALSDRVFLHVVTTLPQVSQVSRS